MRLVIIGNGFDLAHGLPTSFDPDFKEIAEKHESYASFWDCYQSKETNIWSDFENLLAYPELESLEKCFEAFTPDYFSDHERDRNAINTQVDISGNLEEALFDFADKAEKKILNSKPRANFIEEFTVNDFFINFNYTLTLEILYKIPKHKVLHIHGAVNESKLILGYPEGDFKPESYFEETIVDSGYFIEKNVYEYIDSIEDSYIRIAYHDLLSKCKSFSKKYKTDELKKFINNKKIHKIMVIGHSYAIDFPYFQLLNQSFENIEWCLGWHTQEDKKAAEKLVEHLEINKYTFRKF